MNPKGELVQPLEFSQNESSKTPSLVFSVRFLISIVIFFGFTIHYVQRSNMSIAVVCMVNSTAIAELDRLSRPARNFTPKVECSPLFSHKILDGKFVWPKPEQGLILAAYFYGYIVTQVPGGWLAMRFGGRLVILLSILFPSILTLVTPPLANLNIPFILILIRFFIGFGHGLMFSAVAYLFSQWAPVKEKSRLIGFAQAGTTVGSAVTPIMGGFLCENGFYEGWGAIFIISGAVGVLWIFMLIFLTSDSPLNHRFITPAEKNYILEHIPHTPKRIKKLKTPWKKIFTSPPCLVAFNANFFQNWGAYLFLTQTPTYMKDVLKFDIKSNGLYSSFPFLAAFVLTLVSSLTADQLVSKHIMSVKNCRKLFNTLGVTIAGIVSILLCFVDCSEPMMGVVLLTVGFGVIGFVVGSGFIVNINDIGGKHYSGLLFGISNTFGTIPGIIAPYFVGLMTPHGTSEEWRIVFIVTAIFYACGGLPFLLFAGGEVEKWAIVKVQSEVTLDEYLKQPLTDVNNNNNDLKSTNA